MGEELVRSLECADTASTVARVAVPDLADWCAVEILPEVTGERIVAASHGDPDLEGPARSLAAHPVLGQLGSCDELRVVENLSEELLRRDPGAVSSWRSCVRARCSRCRCAPTGGSSGHPPLLRARAAPAGIRERRLAEELGRRAAQAIENALLYLQAREAIRVREDFLSIASHELRTPLSALSLQMRLLDSLLGKPQLPAPGGADLRRRVQSGVRQVDRLSGLVDSLLDLTRIRSGQMELSCESFDLSDFLREVAGRFEDTLAEAAGGSSSARCRWWKPELLAPRPDRHESRRATR